MPLTRAVGACSLSRGATMSYDCRSLGSRTSAPSDPSEAIARAMTARILIVDDVPANTRLLEAKLSAEYYQVASAKDGFEALRMAHDWQPDLILLDVMMPGMDGFECCRQLKDDPDDAAHSSRDGHRARRARRTIARPGSPAPTTS